MIKKHFASSASISILAMTVLLAACGGGSGSTPAASGPSPAGGEQQTPPAKKDPITLTIYTEGVNKEEFDDRFLPSLTKKFPHITIEYIKAAAGTTITDLVAQNKIPDIMRIDVPGLKAKYLDLGLAYGLDELVKKNQYNLNRFDEVFIQEMRNAGRTGELYGLPVPPYFPLVLYYNKDLFDRFGVPYPKDGMTWDEVYEVAKKMTRVENGLVYRGFSSSITAMLRDNPWSLPILDPATDSLTDPEKWKTLFTTFKKFYDIPNNAMDPNLANEGNAFGKGTVAMMANQHNIYLIIPENINWDIVSYPMLPGSPNLMGQRGPAYWSITKQSKYKEEAFQVITEMLSDEVQQEDSKKGIPTTLTNKDIQKTLGASHPVYSKKNMNAVFYYPPTAPTPKRKPELTDVPGRNQEAIIREAFNDVVLKNIDMNTALRTADEKLKLEIAKEKAASGGK
ncbi:MAG: hypothetical protein K0Q94_2033 [Paenibacillus sp.]|nr:hypothetical protein [Paenibacillus sp.]